MKYALYLDDERSPSVEDRPWVIVRTSDAFKQVILEKGLPSYISFDHDLGEGSENGYECLKWFGDWCMDHGVDMRGIEMNAHTANPVGRDNMAGYIASYARFRTDFVEDLVPEYAKCVGGTHGPMVYSVESTNLFRRPMFTCTTCGFGCSAR